MSCDVVHPAAHVANIWYNECTMHEQFSPQPSQLEPTGEITPPTPKRARAIGALASRVTELIAGARERRSARKLEKYKQVVEAQRLNVIGPVADHIAYGLPNSSSYLFVNIPLAYPTTPELLEDQRRLIAETKEPGYYDRIDTMFAAKADSLQPNSSEHRTTS